MALLDAAARLILSGRAPYVRGTGTTHATADTENLVAHGLIDDVGRAITPAQVFAIATSTEAPVYIGTAADATNIDIRSAGTAVPYQFIAFA
ncbi:MAG TPA: hypothetical protein VGA66_02835 [Mycobacterium sp.]